jgi:hypothetical protein
MSHICVFMTWLLFAFDLHVSFIVKSVYITETFMISCPSQERFEND